MVLNYKDQIDIRVKLITSTYKILSGFTFHVICVFHLPFVFVLVLNNILLCSYIALDIFNVELVALVIK
jgi:hypothetical protein